MTWSPEAPQGNEAGKVRHLIVPHVRGRALDIGCGPWKAWPHMISIDNRDEYGGVNWAPDIDADATDLSFLADGSVDAVFSSHLLEHLENTELVLAEWWRVIKPGGNLILYLPHKDFYPNIGEEGGNPDHKHDFMPEDVRRTMLAVAEEMKWGWVMERDEVRSERDEYSFLQIYSKNYMKTKRGWAVFNPSWTRPEKSCLVIRYGGIGDMIQASSVLPGLKEQGYHVTVNTVPMGEEVLRHDPNVDAFMVQDKDQVPQADLRGYWTALGHEFDKVVNLCESVEGTLLATPDRRTHAMPQAARHMLMDVNYTEFLHALAEVPMPARQLFFANENEVAAAKRHRREIGQVPVILWALAGSSVHKIWPWVDIVCAHLLDSTDMKIVFVGGRSEQALEASTAQAMLKYFLGVGIDESDEMKLSDILLRLKAHFGSNRLLCRSGSWDVRQCLSFLPCVDLVIGPETGVLNAAAQLSVPKIVMLSHSTSNNLTKHWTNTVSIEPLSVACYPCHRMHFGREFCPTHESGASVCAASIDPNLVMRQIMAAIYGEAEAPEALEA